MGDGASDLTEEGKPVTLLHLFTQKGPLVVRSLLKIAPTDGPVFVCVLRAWPGGGGGGGRVWERTVTTTHTCPSPSHA